MKNTRTSIAVAALLLAGCGAPEPVERDAGPSLVVVPSLDAPIPAGKSAVWCASFLAAWNQLAREVVKGPPMVRGAEDTCRRLNGSGFVEGDLPEGTFYTAAGWTKDGIRERIRKEVTAAFPSAPTPDLGASGEVAVAYAHLEAGIKFAIPFFESREPLAFRDAKGGVMQVTSFGIRHQDEYAYEDLRAQVEVLFAGPGRPFRLEEFAIDPCKSSEPVQIILACVPPKASLAETVEAVEEKMRGAPADKLYRKIGPNDVLLIPNVVFRIAHRFAELEGMDKGFLNPGMEGAWIGEAFQSIRFRLDRSGAELRSEAKVLVEPLASHYIFDRPFLVYMKKRGDGNPFFALWIEDAELLQRW